VRHFLDQSLASEMLHAYKQMNEEFEQMARFFCFDSFTFSFKSSSMELFFKVLCAAMV
jgi:hypothetical protein